jgi:hypothetical protein
MWKREIVEGCEDLEKESVIWTQEVNTENRTENDEVIKKNT